MCFLLIRCFCFRQICTLAFNHTVLSAFKVVLDGAVTLMEVDPHQVFFFLEMNNFACIMFCNRRFFPFQEVVADLDDEEMGGHSLLHVVMDANDSDLHEAANLFSQYFLKLCRDKVTHPSTKVLFNSILFSSHAFCPTINRCVRFSLVQDQSDPDFSPLPQNATLGCSDSRTQYIVRLIKSATAADEFLNEVVNLTYSFPQDQISFEQIYKLSYNCLLVYFWSHMMHETLTLLLRFQTPESIVDSHMMPFDPHVNTAAETHASFNVRIGTLFVFLNLFMYQFFFIVVCYGRRLVCY
jgi:hypothetical protein